MSRSRTPLLTTVAALCALLPLAACLITTDLDDLSGGDAALNADSGGVDSSTKVEGDGSVGGDSAVSDAPTVDAPADAPLDVPASCTVQTTAARSAGAVTASGGGQTWVSASSAAVADGASATVALSTSTDESQFLVASNFGFAIPATAQIRGITVTVRAKGTAADPSEVRDESLRLAPNGVPAGTDKANADYTSTLVTRSYGGPTDVWALSGVLTPAVVNGAGFGAWLSVKFHDTGTASADVDAITIAVTTCE